MLPLTRPRRQLCATAALVALTIAPTFYVVALAWQVNRPGHARDVETAIGRQLGLRVTLDAVRYPRPDEVVYRGVTVRQEQGRGGARLSEIARAESLRVRTDAGQLIAEADGLVLRGDGPKAALAPFAALLQRAGDAPADRVSLTARSARIDLGDGLRYEVRNLAAQCRREGEAGVPTVAASYQIGDGAAVTRCELTLSREAGSRTVIALQTMEGPPLPARVLDPFFESAAWLGASARVEGQLRLEQVGAADWDAQFQGKLHEVDLAALFADRFPGHRMAGRAMLTIDRARWADRPGQGPGWVEARGSLTAGPGTISTGLLRALAAELRFGLPSPIEEMHLEDVAFHGLGLGFMLEADGQIRLGGALGNAHAPGVVLVRGNRLDPLALAPEGAANVRGLWKALFPAGDDVLVPLTAESQVLRYLPTPAGPAAIGPARGN